MQNSKTTIKHSRRPELRNSTAMEISSKISSREVNIKGYIKAQK